MLWTAGLTSRDGPIAEPRLAPAEESDIFHSNRFFSVGLASGVCLLFAVGVPPVVGSTAVAECTGEECRSSGESPEAGQREDRTGKLEKAKELRDRGIEVMDEQKKRALELFERSLELNPDDGLTWANHGTVLLNLGSHDEALESYRRSLEVRPDHAYTHCSIASVYNAEDRPEEAIEAAERALEVDSEFAPAYLNKARALEELGQRKRAETLRQRALEIDPSLEEHVD